jgi:hypothetical protein
LTISQKRLKNYRINIHKKDIRIASVFSFVYAVISIIYSIGLIYDKLSSNTATLYLILVTILVSIILLYFKRFLKYFYNYRDKGNFMVWIIILEIIHALYIIVFSNGLQKSNDFYFIYSSMAILLSTILLLFYAIFASKLLTLSRKRTTLILPFALSFYLIPIITIVSFSYSIFVGDSVIHAIDYNNSALILTFLKLFPFLLLPILYIQAYRQKKSSHSNKRRKY